METLHRVTRVEQWLYLQAPSFSSRSGRLHYHRKILHYLLRRNTKESLGFQELTQMTQVSRLSPYHQSIARMMEETTNTQRCSEHHGRAESRWRLRRQHWRGCLTKYLATHAPSQQNSHAQAPGLRPSAAADSCCTRTHAVTLTHMLIYIPHRTLTTNFTHTPYRYL